MLPCDVEYLSEGVKDGENGGVMLDDEDNGRQERQYPADGEANNPPDDPCLEGTFARIRYIVFKLLVGPFISRFVALISHQIISQLSNISIAKEQAEH